MLSAVVFDFDGLILDTENAEFQAWSSVFSDHGASLEISEWSKCVGGGPDVWSVETHFQSLCPTANLASAVESWRERRDDIINRLSPKPGVKELIADLQAESVPIAIASSSRSVWVQGLLASIEMQACFPIVWTRDRAGKPKPWPDVYLKACEELGVDPSRSVALEDSPNGCRSARAAGMKIVGCPNDVTRQFFDSALCDLTVESLAEVNTDTLRGLWR